MSKHDADHGSSEAMACHWRGCTVGGSFENSIHLFEHITKCHIGRKANNNLCLQCHWEECHFEAKKRDHITSHMRSHIDYRPHMCPYCRKTFKRPQDLKKHEKTHSESLPTPVSAGVTKGAVATDLHRSSISSDYYPAYQSAPTTAYPPPTSHATGHLAVSSPHTLPDSPSSLNAYVPELSPDNVVPSTGVTISDQSDSESTHPGHGGGAQKRPRDPLEDLLANNKAKQQATYNQETRAILERLMTQNAANALSLENNPSLNTENIKDLYQFFEDVYKSASSVDVSESLEAATTAQPLYPIGFMPDTNLTIDFDNPAFHGMVHPPTASVATAAQAMVPSTAGFDITVQPFDESSYLPTFPNPVLGSMATPGMVPTTVGIAPGMAPQFASPVGVAPNMVGGGVMPPHAIPGPMGMVPGNPAFSMYGMSSQPMQSMATTTAAMVTPKGFIHQATPVARVISQPQPVNYQLYTMQPQMKAREESLDPEVVESVFHEVIDDSKVTQAPASTDHQVPAVPSQAEKGVDAVRAQSEPAPESAHRFMSLSVLEPVPSLSPSALSAASSLSPSPHMSPASSPRPPTSPISLPARSSRLPTQRRVESATVFSPTASPAVDPTTVASPTTTRSFMYPSRPYNQRISMTEGGDDEEYVDIAVHTNQSRTRTRPLTAVRPLAADPSLKATCERHADFAATMLARLYELLAHGSSRADQPKDTASLDDHHHSETDDEYIKLEKDECPVESARSSESIKDDLLAKFQQLSVGLVSSPKATTHPFDITQSPEDADEMATYDEQIAKGYPAIPQLPSVLQ